MDFMQSKIKTNAIDDMIIEALQQCRNSHVELQVRARETYVLSQTILLYDSDSEYGIRERRELIDAHAELERAMRIYDEKVLNYTELLEKYDDFQRNYTRGWNNSEWSPSYKVVRGVIQR